MAERNSRIHSGRDFSPTDSIISMVETATREGDERLMARMTHILRTDPYVDLPGEQTESGRVNEAITQTVGDDWRYQGFGIPVEDGQKQRMYSGSKLEERGLVREGVHDETAVEVTDKNGATREIAVFPVVWPSNAAPGDKRITLFIPKENGTKT